jgi:excisionase family DNA binding protein
MSKTSASELSPLMTVRQVAQMFEVTEATVRTWLAEGVLEGTKTANGAGHWRVSRQEASNLAQKRYGATGS